MMEDPSKVLLRDLSFTVRCFIGNEGGGQLANSEGVKRQLISLKRERSRKRATRSPLRAGEKAA